jgi:hypothetical protein
MAILSLQNSNAADGETAETGKETPWEQAKTEGRYVLRAYLWLFALTFASALLTPRDILASHPFLRNYFIGFCNIIGFLHGRDANELLNLFHFNEVAHFTIALLSIATILLIIFYPRPPSRGVLPGLLFWCFIMTSFFTTPILSSKKMLAFYSGLLQKGYISSEVVDFMSNSRMGLAFVIVFFMMIAPILLIALRFFINALIAASAK